MNYAKLFVGSAIIFTFACGSDDTGPGMMNNKDGGVTTDAAMLGDWQSVVEATWDLAPGATDTYFCATGTITEEIYIGGIRDVSPTGTHHTVLTLVDEDLNGTVPCDAGTLGEQMIYASGVGTDPLLFPEGVALKLNAGQRVHINVHTFNASDTRLEDVTTAIEVAVTPKASVVHEAEMVFAGTVLFQIPDNSMEYSANGSCTFAQDGTLVNLWPHMHQLGRHMTVEHEGTMLLDEAFNFNEQKNYPMDNVLIQAGESLDVTCTWVNDTGRGGITFGDSSEQEMCFAGFVRYPATGASTFCSLPL